MQRLHPTRLKQTALQQGLSASPQLNAGTDRLLTMKAVVGITSWSRTSINRLVQEGRFPSPLKIGKQKIAFREAEIRAYVEAQCRRPDASRSGNVQT
jgi:predicted DNA-binding transcriptional regulator AlpA